MRNISFTVIFLIIIIFIFQSWDIGTYRSFGKSSLPPALDSIRVIEFIEAEKVIISPSKEDWLISYINNAKIEIKVAIYMFTIPSLRDALLNAKNRGVDVQILLENNPYNAATINRETITFLKENEIMFHETGKGEFSFMHAKYMIFDNIWIISTANWTRSSFKSNREFSVIGNDGDILSTLKEVFINDFNNNTLNDVSPKSLIVGPTHTRELLIQLLASSSKNIRIYMPSITDEGIIRALKKSCQNNISVSILLNKSEENRMNADRLQENGCPQIKMMKSPSLHGKVVLIDDKKGFIGSFNFTQNSLENNRELGIFLNGKNILTIVNMFIKDWGNSVAI